MRTLKFAPQDVDAALTEFKGAFLALLENVPVEVAPDSYINLLRKAEADLLARHAERLKVIDLAFEAKEIADRNRPTLAKLVRGGRAGAHQAELFVATGDASAPALAPGAAPTTRGRGEGAETPPATHYATPGGVATHAACGEELVEDTMTSYLRNDITCKDCLDELD